MPSPEARGPVLLRHFSAFLRYSENCFASSRLAARSALGSSDLCVLNIHCPPLPLPRM